MNKQRKNSKGKSGWIIGGVVILVVAAGLWWRGRMAVNSVVQAQTGDIIAAFMGDLSVSATASGQMRAQREGRVFERLSSRASWLILPAALIYVAVIIGAAAIVAGVWMSRRLTQPLTALQAGARAKGNGRLLPTHGEGPRRYVAGGAVGDTASSGSGCRPAAAGGQ
jgi:hypothetical protein